MHCRFCAGGALLGWLLLELAFAVHGSFELFLLLFALGELCFFTGTAPSSEPCPLQMKCMLHWRCCAAVTSPAQPEALQRKSPQSSGASGRLQATKSRVHRSALRALVSVLVDTRVRAARPVLTARRPTQSVSSHALRCDLHEQR